MNHGDTEAQRKIVMLLDWGWRKAETSRRKSENRRPKSERNPKAEIRCGQISVFPPFGFLSDLGFRPSDFPRDIPMLRRSPARWGQRALPGHPLALLHAYWGGVGGVGVSVGVKRPSDEHRGHFSVQIESGIGGRYRT